MLVSLVYAPRFAVLFRKGEIPELQRTFRNASAVAVAVGGAIFIAYAVFGTWMIRVVAGSEYEAALTPMIALSLIHVLTLWAAGANTLLVMAGYERRVLTSSGWSASVNVVLSLILIPYIGIWGAVSATGASLFLWRYLMWHYYVQIVRSTHSSV